MSAVWEQAPVDGGSLLVLLAMADFANDNGICWPSVASLARKARLSERQVQRTLRDLADAKLIIVDKGTGPHGVNTYKILARGDKMSPGVTPAGVTPTSGGGDTHVVGGVTPTSPNPSLDPSLATTPATARARVIPNIFALFEELTGRTFDALLADELEEAANEHTSACIAYAFHEAAVNEARNWAYPRAILAGHAAGQCGAAARKRPQRRDAKDRQRLARKGARSTGVPITGPDIEAGKRFLAGKV